VKQDFGRISIAELLAERGESMHMRLINKGSDLNRYLDRPRVQKPSFALCGFLEGLNPHLLHVIGNTGMHYLNVQTEDQRRDAINAMFDLGLTAIVITCGQTPPEAMLQAARQTKTPLMVTDMETSAFMTDMMFYLTRRLAPRMYQHGVYVDVFGLGVLITGASGIGKSEIALELITRGHRFIADDMVELSRPGPDVLVGKSPDALRYHMEIRGLGILNIRDLFGAAALTDTKRVGLVVEAVPWESLSGEERVLTEERTIEIHDVHVAKVIIPIRPGRSLAVLVEVAARNHLLKQRGVDSSKEFVHALQERIQQGQS